MSGECFGWAKKQDAPDRNTKTFLAFLGDYADEGRFAWPAVGKLAAECQCSERTIQRMLRALERARLLVACEVVDRATGRTRTRAYYFPLDGLEPDAIELRRYGEKVGGRVTLVSPWEGDKGVTGEGDKGVTGRVTTVSPLNELPLDPERADALSERARADEPTVQGGAQMDPAAERAFEALVEAWPTAGLDNTSLPRARVAFAAALPEVGDPARLAAAGRDYAAEVGRQKRDYPPASLQSWLERGSWRHRLSKVDVGAPAWRFNGPEDLRAELLKRAGEAEFRSYIEPSAWTEDPPAIRPKTGIAETWINKNLGAFLADRGVAVVRVGAGA